MPFLPETWTDPHATFTPLTWALILLAPLILPLAVSTAVGLLTHVARETPRRHPRARGDPEEP